MTTFRPIDASVSLFSELEQAINSLSPAYFFDVNSENIICYADVYDELHRQSISFSSQNSITSTSPFSQQLYHFLHCAIHYWFSTVPPSQSALAAPSREQFQFLSQVFFVIEHLYALESTLVSQMLTRMQSIIDNVESKQIATDSLPLPSVFTFLSPYQHDNEIALQPNNIATSDPLFFAPLLARRSSLVLSLIADISFYWWNSPSLLSPPESITAITSSSWVDAPDPFQKDNLMNENVLAPLPVRSFFIPLWKFLFNMSTPDAIPSIEQLPSTFSIPLDSSSRDKLYTNAQYTSIASRLPLGVLSQLYSPPNCGDTVRTPPVIAWRKAYVKRFTRFNKYNLLHECVEGYAKLFFVVEQHFLTISHQFQLHTIALVHDWLETHQTATTTTTAQNTNEMVTTPPPSSASSIFPDVSFEQMLSYDYIVFILLQRLFLHQSSSKKSDPIVDSFIAIFNQQVESCRSSISHLLGSFDLDVSRVFDVITLLYLHLVFFNFHQPIFSPILLSRHESLAELPAAPFQPFVDEITSQHSPSSCSSLMTSFFQLVQPLTAHSETALSSSAHSATTPQHIALASNPMFAMLLSPMTLLYVSLLRSFQPDVVMSSIGWQVMTLSEPSSNILTSSSLYQLNTAVAAAQPAPTAGAALRAAPPRPFDSIASIMREKTPFDISSTQHRIDRVWVPILYVISLLLRFRIVTFDDIVPYFILSNPETSGQPHQHLLHHVSQCQKQLSLHITDKIKDLHIVRLSKASSKSATSGIGQANDEIAQPIKAISPTEIAFLKTNDNNSDPTLPSRFFSAIQSLHLPPYMLILEQYTQQPLLLLFSAVFTFDVFDYIAMLQKHTAIAFMNSAAAKFASFEKNVDQYVYTALQHCLPQHIGSLQQQQQQAALLKDNKDHSPTPFDHIHAPFLPLYHDPLPFIAPPKSESDASDDQTAAAAAPPPEEDEFDRQMREMMGLALPMDLLGASDGQTKAKKHVLGQALPIYPFVSFTPYVSCLSVDPSDASSSTVSEEDMGDVVPIATISQSYNDSLQRTKLTLADEMYLQLQSCGELPSLFNIESLQRQLYNLSYLQSTVSSPNTATTIGSSGGSGGSGGSGSGVDVTAENAKKTTSHQVQLLSVNHLAELPPLRLLQPATVFSSPNTTLTENVYINLLLLRLHAFMNSMHPVIALLGYLYKPSSFTEQPKPSVSHLPNLSLTTVKAILQHVLILMSPLGIYIATSPVLFTQICELIAGLLHHVRMTLVFQSQQDRFITQRTYRIQQSTESFQISLLLPNILQQTGAAAATHTAAGDHVSATTTSVTSTLFELFSLLSHVLLPAHIALPSSFTYQNHLWSILSQFSYHDRFALYYQQYALHNDKHLAPLYTTLYERYLNNLYIVRTKWARKRLASDKPQEMAYLSQTFLQPAPFVSIDLLLDHILRFKAISQPVVEICGNSSSFLLDIMNAMCFKRIIQSFSKQPQITRLFSRNDSMLSHFGNESITIDQIGSFLLLLAKNYPSQCDLIPLLDIICHYTQHYNVLHISTILNMIFQHLANVQCDHELAYANVATSTSSWWLQNIQKSSNIEFDQPLETTTKTALLLPLPMVRKKIHNVYQPIPESYCQHVYNMANIASIPYLVHPSVTASSSSSQQSSSVIGNENVSEMTTTTTATTTPVNPSLQQQQQQPQQPPASSSSLYRTHLYSLLPSQLDQNVITHLANTSPTVISLCIESLHKSVQQFVSPTTSPAPTVASSTPPHSLIPFQSLILLRYNAQFASTFFSSSLAAAQSSLLAQSLQLPFSPSFPVPLPTSSQIITSSSSSSAAAVSPAVSLPQIFASTLQLPATAIPLVQYFTPHGRGLLLAIAFACSHAHLLRVSGLQDYTTSTTLLDQCMRNLSHIRNFLAYYCEPRDVLRHAMEFNPYLTTMQDVNYTFKLPHPMCFYLFRPFLHAYTSVYHPNPARLTRDSQLPIIAVDPNHPFCGRFVPHPIVQFVSDYYSSMSPVDPSLYAVLEKCPPVLANPQLPAPSAASAVAAAAHSTIPRHFLSLFSLFWWLDGSHIHHHVHPGTSIRPSSASLSVTLKSATTIAHSLYDLQRQTLRRRLDNNVNALRSTLPNQTHLVSALSTIAGQKAYTEHSSAQFQSEIVISQLAECDQQEQEQIKRWQTYRPVFNWCTILPFPQSFTYEHPVVVTTEQAKPVAAADQHNDETVNEAMTDDNQQPSIQSTDDTIATATTQPTSPKTEHLTLNSSQDFHTKLSREQKLAFLSLPHNIILSQFFNMMLLTSCILPRIRQSHIDAYYCAHFIHALRHSHAIGFNFMHFVDIFVEDIATLLTQVTKDEVDRIGTFINELLLPIGAIVAIDHAIPSNDKKTSFSPGLVTKAALASFPAVGPYATAEYKKTFYTFLNSQTAFVLRPLDTQRDTTPPQQHQFDIGNSLLQVVALSPKQFSDSVVKWFSILSSRLAKILRNLAISQSLTDNGPSASARFQELRESLAAPTTATQSSVDSRGIDFSPDAYLAPLKAAQSADELLAQKLTTTSPDCLTFPPPNPTAIPTTLPMAISPRMDIPSGDILDDERLQFHEQQAIKALSLLKSIFPSFPFFTQSAVTIFAPLTELHNVFTAPNPNREGPHPMFGFVRQLEVIYASTSFLGGHGSVTQPRNAATSSSSSSAATTAKSASSKPATTTATSTTTTTPPVANGGTTTAGSSTATTTGAAATATTTSTATTTTSTTSRFDKKSLPGKSEDSSTKPPQQKLNQSSKSDSTAASKFSTTAAATATTATTTKSSASKFSASKPSTASTASTGVPTVSSASTVAKSQPTQLTQPTVVKQQQQQPINPTSVSTTRSDRGVPAQLVKAQAIPRQQQPQQQQQPQSSTTQPRPLQPPRQPVQQSLPPTQRPLPHLPTRPGPPAAHPSPLPQRPHPSVAGNPGGSGGLPPLRNADTRAPPARPGNIAPIEDSNQRQQMGSGARPNYPNANAPRQPNPRRR